MSGSLRLLVAVTTTLWLSGAPPAAGLDCEAPGQAEMLLRRAEVVLLGEIHGTQEAPRLVGEIACAALRLGHAVIVGVEMPRNLQPALEAYLASDGGREAMIELLDDEFWKRDYQDGRASQAMFELIEATRLLRADEQPVAMVAFDIDRREQDRDRSMALELSRVAADSRDHRLIALTGNLHARRARNRAPGARQPMGFHFGMATPGREIVSLNLTHSGGTAWICTGGSAADCGVRRLGGSEAPTGLELSTGGRDENFSGRWHLGPITASPPAWRTGG